MSPRAIVDVAFVIFAAVRLLRTLARIYGGRPGLFGFLRLAKAAFNHLAVTGGMAVGDSLMQQVLGLGLAARISAKLGEGVLNGLMTARFGLAALSVCRPLPFIREETPKIGDVAGRADQPGGGGGRLRVRQIVRPLALSKAQKRELGLLDKSMTLNIVVAVPACLYRGATVHRGRTAEHDRYRD